MHGEDILEGEDVKRGPASLALAEELLALAIAADDERAGKLLQ